MPTKQAILLACAEKYFGSFIKIIFVKLKNPSWVTPL